MNQKKEVYVCVTLYHLYLSLLIINKRRSKKNCMLLLNANDPKIFEQFCHLREMLCQNGYKVDCRLRNKAKDIIGLEELINRKQYSLAKRVLQSELDGDFILFNFAWNLQYVYTTANLFYKKCEHAYFIEEGVLTPINPAQPKYKVIIKRLLGGSVNYYRNEKLKGVYIQNPEIYPAEWRKKLKRLEVKPMLDLLDDKTKKMILEVFLGNFIDKLNTVVGNDVGIIYTQPLSEDGYITESEKQKYFLEMVTYYKKYGRPVVKIHPRDIMEYPFPDDVAVLPAYFPSELLALLDIRFKYAVGICTSAVPTTNAEIKLNINENFLNDRKFRIEPLERFVSIK